MVMRTNGRQYSFKTCPVQTSGQTGLKEKHHAEVGFRLVAGGFDRVVCNGSNTGALVFKPFASGLECPGDP
jgi:hypothetical protein